MEICWVCKDAAAFQPLDGGERGNFSCDGFGLFIMTKTASHELEKWPNKRAVVARWIRRTCDAGGKPEIDQARLVEIIVDEVPPIPDQADETLLYLGDELTSLGNPDGYLKLTGYRRIGALVGATPGPNSPAVLYLAKGLAEEGYLYPRPSQYDNSVGLTFKGWRRYGELRRARVDSRLAFMAMPFGHDQLNQVFNAFRTAVADTGFELRRIIDDPPAGLIDDRLRVEIRKSRFMICELTNSNPGAYWEAGFAEGLGRPVIYSCEKSFFDAKQTHFDTNHCHTVLWVPEDLANAATRMKASIRATLPTEAK
jgi:hypothetical protein